MKYKHLIIIYNSRPDRSGNCYWAFRLIDNVTGNQVEATFAGNTSNILAMMREFTGYNQGGEYPYVYVEKDMAIRDFNSYTGSWKYAGCNPSELAEYCRKNLNTNEHPKNRH